MVTVVLPSSLNRPELAGDVLIDEPVATIAELVNALDSRYPGLAAQIDDAIFTFVVNGRIALHHARHTPVFDGDVVEILSASS